MVVMVITMAAVVMLSAQDRGNDRGQCSLAIVSRNVRSNVPVCDKETVLKLARGGHVFEQNQLGIASTLVIGPGYSDKEALKWFEQASHRGYAPAEVNLAVMYINGWGTAVNYGAAQNLLRDAADQHFARAYYNLGILYLEGKGVKQDNAEAFRWFQKGAEAGDSSAQTNLGYMYDQGLGCEPNAETAAKWYQKAADGGNPLGQNNLADLYLRGEGVKQNDALAFDLFQRAASQGHTGAQIKLAYMFANGRAVGKNPVAAYSWLSVATTAGDRRGTELLHAVEKKLTSKELAEAREMATKLGRAEMDQAASNFVQ